jgi:hypothetical protein
MYHHYLLGTTKSRYQMSNFYNRNKFSNGRIFSLINTLRGWWEKGLTKMSKFYNSAFRNRKILPSKIRLPKIRLNNKYVRGGLLFSALMIVASCVAYIAWYSYVRNDEQDMYEQRLIQKLLEFTKNKNGWEIITGKWEIKRESVRYLGPTHANPSINYGIILSKTRILTGFLETTVNVTDKLGNAQIIFRANPTGKSFYTAGIGDNYAYVLREFPIGRIRGYFGAKRDFVLNSNYKMVISLNRHSVSLTVNNIKLLNSNLPQHTDNNQVGFWASGLEPVEFQSIRFKNQDARR